MQNLLRVSLLSALVFWVISVHGDTQRLPPWEKFDEQDGITVYRREVPGSPIVALRGEGIVNRPILRVTSVIIDTSRATEWIDSLAEARTLRKISDVEYTEWDHVETPFILKDREFVFVSKLELDARHKQISLNYHSINDNLAPKTDYVRGEFKYGTFKMTSIEHGTKTRILVELMCDPRGSIAKWIVNLFQKSWPYNTIVALRTQASKANIRDNQQLKQALGTDYN